MSTTELPPDSPDAEELVAYLDGELPPDNCRQVERRLSDDARYRHELAELEQAWTALDELPRATARDNFARTTIEMVAVTAERELAGGQRAGSVAGKLAAAVAVPGYRRTLMLAAWCGALAAAGFAAIYVVMPNSDDALVDNLPVVAQLDVLSEVSDLDFLRGLSEIEFAPRLDDRDSNVATATRAVPADATARRAWIQQLPQDKQAELSVKLARFQALSPDAERDRLRSLEREIAAAGDRDRLLANLAAYGQWIKSLTPGKRTELREIAATDERLRAVKRLVEQAERELQPLSIADEKALQEAILDFVDERRQQLMQELQRREVPDHQRRVEGRSMAVVASLVILREIRDERVQEYLISRLSPATRDYMDSLPRRQRARQLWQWCREALDPRFGPRELEEFFVDALDNDQRERLLSLPAADMREQLEQLYLGSQVGLRGRDWLDDAGPPRFGRGGPGRPGRPGRGPREPFFDNGPDRRGPPPREFGDGPPDRRRFDRGPEGPPPASGPPPHGPPPDEPI